MITIYQIYCKDPKITDIYIGSTTKTVQQRFSWHKKDSKIYQTNFYKFVSENGEWENWTYKILNQIEDHKDRELRFRQEQCYIDLYNPTLNTRSAFLSYDEKQQYIAEYQKNNKESISEKSAEYRKNNKETIAKRKAEYRKNNKESIAEKSAEYQKNNKEAIAKRKAEYRKNNKEAISEYYEKNKDKINEKKRVQRAKKKSDKLLNETPKISATMHMFEF